MAIRIVTSISRSDSQFHFHVGSLRAGVPVLGPDIAIFAKISSGAQNIMHHGLDQGKVANCTPVLAMSESHTGYIDSMDLHH